MKQYNIAIIGSGIGGLSAAIHASKKCDEVVVLERGSQVDGSECAGGLASTVMDMMQIEPNDKCIVNKFSKVNIHLPNGKILDIRMKTIEGLVIDKTRLLQKYVDIAERNGAEIMFNSKVMKYDNECIYTKDEKIRTRVIIDASGFNTRMAIGMGLVPKLVSKDIGIAAQYLIEHDNINKDCMELYLGGKMAPMGYAWVFPTDDCVGRVGLGVIAESGRNPKKLLNRFIDSKYPGCNKSNYIGAPMPLAKPLDKLVYKNIMLVGDCAHAMLAATGAGNAFAYATGMWAGEYASYYIHGEGSLSEYDDIIRMQLYKKLNRSYKLKERVWRGGDKTLIRLFRVIRPVFWLHRLLPGTIEKYGLRNWRWS